MNKEQFARSVFDAINSDRDGFKNLFENWFEQNPIKPTVVGLTGDQVEGFMTFWANSPSSDYIGLYKEWAKTQTFTQSRVFTDSEIQQKYQELYDDYQSLLIDKQMLEPNWNNAPEWATHLQTKQFWWNVETDHSYSIINKVEQRPKPPAPVIEVGQVWKRNEIGGFSCEVMALNDEKVVIGIKECSDFAIIELSDFLANFEKVQS